METIVRIAGNAGAVRLAVRALRSFPEDPPVIKIAFYVLGNLVFLQRFCEEALSSNALVLVVAALGRCAKQSDVQGAACYCLARLCDSDDAAVTADALSMGAMKLALAALRSHRTNEYASANASSLSKVLCFDETCAVKAKQLGALVLLQAALKAHSLNKDVQREVAAALAYIQRFVDAA